MNIPNIKVYSGFLLLTILISTEFDVASSETHAHALSEIRSGSIHLGKNPFFAHQESTNSVETSAPVNIFAPVGSSHSNAGHAIKDGTTLHAYLATNAVDTAVVETAELARPQCIPPKKETIVAPYATCARAFSRGLIDTNGCRALSMIHWCGPGANATNGIAPAAPSATAARGTFNILDDFYVKRLVLCFI